MRKGRTCSPEQSISFLGIAHSLSHVFLFVCSLLTFFLLPVSCASRGIKKFSPPALKISIYFESTSLVVEGTGIRKLEVCVEKKKEENVECVEVPLSSSSFLPSKVRITEPERAKKLFLVIYGFREKKIFLVDFSEKNFRLLRVFSRPSLSSQGRTQYVLSHV